jgi:hypothetical protein
MGLQVAPPTSDDGPGFTDSRYVSIFSYVISFHVAVSWLGGQPGGENWIIKRLAGKENISIIPRDLVSMNLEKSGKWRRRMTSRLNQTSGTTLKQEPGTPPYGAQGIDLKYSRYYSIILCNISDDG